MPYVMFASDTAFKALLIGTSWLLWLVGLAVTICAGRPRARALTRQPAEAIPARRHADVPAPAPRATGA
jgi:hypothetical protein